MWNVFQFFLQITNLKNEIYVKSSSRHTWRLRAQGTGSMGFSLFPVFLASSPALLIINIQNILYCLIPSIPMIVNQFWTHADEIIVILKRKRHLSCEQISQSRKRVRTTLGEEEKSRFYLLFEIKKRLKFEKQERESGRPWVKPIENQRKET